MTTEATSARVDSWLWAVRVFKSRSQATAAVKAGHVRVNGERAKSATSVKVKDLSLIHFCRCRRRREC